MILRVKDGSELLKRYPDNWIKLSEFHQLLVEHKNDRPLVNEMLLACLYLIEHRINRNTQELLDAMKEYPHVVADFFANLTI
jgi:hypothetical protein